MSRQLHEISVYFIKIHRFHEASWKAFGKVLWETVFDLHSPQSMDTLLTVSACQDLAPWVTKLVLGFYSAPAYMRGDLYARSVAQHLSLDGREGLHRICAAE